jgi:hypothetical protein
MRIIAYAYSEYQQDYNNIIYDSSANGEERVLDVLTGQTFRHVFDVGANEGVWSRYAVKAFPSSPVHAFEIVSSTRSVLTKNTAQHSRILVNDVGLSDREGSVTVNYFLGNSSLSSMFTFPYEGER